MCKLSTFRVAFQEHVVISSHIIKMKGKGSLRSFRAPGRRRQQRRKQQFVQGRGFRSFFAPGRKTRLNYRGRGKKKYRRHRRCRTIKGKGFFSDWALESDKAFRTLNFGRKSIFDE